MRHSIHGVQREGENKKEVPENVLVIVLVVDGTRVERIEDFCARMDIGRKDRGQRCVFFGSLGCVRWRTMDRGVDIRAGLIRRDLAGRLKKCAGNCEGTVQRGGWKMVTM